MRSKLFLPLFGAMMIILFSCQKQEIKQENNDQLISKVNSWLDGRKPDQKPIQAENVELLKNNLQFSDLRIENSNNEEKIVIIPVSENFKTLKNLDKASIPNLVLIMDKMGNVRKGNIILFYPKTGVAYNKVPENTFYDILNTAKPKTNGKFKYLSVTGKKIHELEYENGHLKEFGHIKDSIPNGNRTNTNCVDWYWVTTVYDEWGFVISETWDYYTTTCQGEDCTDPYNAMLCPMDNSSGGGTGDAEGWEYAVQRFVQWKVKDNGVSGSEIWSGETIKGKRNSTYPNGGYFTDIDHWNSWCVSCPQNGVWGESSNSSVNYTSSQATSFVNGNLYYQGIAFNYFDTKNWSFNNVF
jgi:hypothetical protein